MLMDKTQIPVVAIDEMNKTHANEVDLINNLYEMIASHLAGEPKNADLDQAVTELRAHVERHFSREEEMMEQVGFPAFSVHKGEHDRVRAELDLMLEKLQQSNDFAPLENYLKNVYPDWSKNHIATMDTMTAFYITRNTNS